MIHQVKSWLRTTYSWVSVKNIDRYFNEFSYRINRSQSKETIFNNKTYLAYQANQFTVWKNTFTLRPAQILVKLKFSLR